MVIKRDKFDFEVGYFVKSPCKECENRELFPKCADTCPILDNIHGILARCVSCSYSSSR